MKFIELPSDRISISDMKCPSCQASVSLVEDSTVYGRSYGGFIYICNDYPFCNTYVGADKKTGKPVGTMAGPQLRYWRIKAHKSFDKLWKEKHMTRQEAYTHMSKIMGLDPDEAHIGQFDIGQCKQLIELLF